MRCPRGSAAGHLSGSDRATRCPTEGESPPRGDASRPRPVGGVNELVKYAEIDVRCAAAPAPWRVDSNSMKGPPCNAADRLSTACPLAIVTTTAWPAWSLKVSVPLSSEASPLIVNATCPAPAGQPFQIFRLPSQAVPNSYPKLDLLWDNVIAGPGDGPSSRASTTSMTI